MIYGIFLNQGVLGSLGGFRVRGPKPPQIPTKVIRTLIGVKGTQRVQVPK